MDFNGLEILAKLALFFPPFLFALCFHEFAHGWAAKKFGDNTAEMMGRLTLNPVPHLDIIGTIILPAVGVIMGGGVGFGWAKPVPVNERNLTKPKQQMFWIAFAGPLSNILMGFVGALLFVLAERYLPGGPLAPFISMLNFFVQINCALAVFNLIPLHPLDGGKVIARFLPDNINQKMENRQQEISWILFAFLFMGGFKILAYPIIALITLFMSTATAIFSFL